jgi:hypothetical protein
MSSETPVGPPTEVMGDGPEAADAAEQMAAATSALRARFPMLQADAPTNDPYPG